MRTTPWPVKRCKSCTRPFSARPRTVKGRAVWPAHCSWACAQETVRKNTRGKPLAAALAARYTKSLARWKAQLTSDFGVLSDREVELMRREYQRGYNQGYAKAYAPLRKERVAS